MTNARRLRLWHYLLLALLAASGIARAQLLTLESAGARAGASPTDTTHNFHQAEGFLNCNFPWRWDLGSQWQLQTRLDLSAGWLADPSKDAFIATAGPSLLLGREHLPFSLEAGFSPTLISRHEFATRNFGSAFQFTVHAGLNFDFAAHWRVGYRFQHMSNAGLGYHNPGLNLHVFTLSYLF